MAIYVGIKLESREGVTRTCSFFSSGGKRHGMIGVDIETIEIVLLHAEDDISERFAFPRARRAIENAFTRGDLPDELCCAA
jgi:hypothetical protein